MSKKQIIVLSISIFVILVASFSLHFSSAATLTPILRFWNPVTQPRTGSVSNTARIANLIVRAYNADITINQIAFTEATSATAANYQIRKASASTIYAQNVNPVNKEIVFDNLKIVVKKGSYINLELRAKTSATYGQFRLDVNRINVTNNTNMVLPGYWKDGKFIEVTYPLIGATYNFPEAPATVKVYLGAGTPSGFKVPGLQSQLMQFSIISTDTDVNLTGMTFKQLAGSATNYKLTELAMGRVLNEKINPVSGKISFSNFTSGVLKGSVKSYAVYADTINMASGTCIQLNFQAMTGQTKLSVIGLPMDGGIICF